MAIVLNAAAKATEPPVRRHAIEGRLAGLFGYGEAVLFGRARSGLAALLGVTGGGGISAILPATICPSVYATFRSVGARVLLAEIEIETGLASDAMMADLVMRTPGRGVVMPAHLYGFVAAYPRTLGVAHERGWLVVENDAFATKLRTDNGHTQEAFGDVMLVSFGHEKTVDAGEGGAMLVNDPRLAAELREMEARLPRIDRRAHEVEAYFTRIKRLLRTRVPQGPSLAGLCEHLLFHEFSELNYGFDDGRCETLEAALDEFGENVRRRREKAALWRRHLRSCGGSLHWPTRKQPVPWRTIVCVHGRRDVVAGALWREGFDAGINYPPLTDFYPTSLAGQACSGAQAWGRDVRNLWVTDDYDEARIRAVADVIKRSLERATRESGKP